MYNPTKVDVGKYFRELASNEVGLLSATSDTDGLMKTIESLLAKMALSLASQGEYVDSTSSLGRSLTTSHWWWIM